LRDFKFDVARQRLTHRPWSTTHLLSGLLRLRLFAQSEITLFNQPFDQLVEHLLELRAFELAFILREHLLNLPLFQQTLIHQRLQQRAAQRIERGVLRRSLPGPVVSVVVTGIEQRIRQRLHQIAEVERRDIETVELSVADESHFLTKSSEATDIHGFSRIDLRMLSKISRLNSGLRPKLRSKPTSISVARR